MPTHSRNTILLATDQQRSVLSTLDVHGLHPIAYAPYGHRPAENGLLSLLGFNGEPPDPLTGCYHLGNGYRQFNPVLMRFNSPDSWSPFGEGGLNAYGYCGGDPTNRVDPTGHVFNAIGKFLGFGSKSAAKKASKINSKIGSYPFKNTDFFANVAAKDGNFGVPRVTKIQAVAKNNKVYVIKQAKNEVFQFETKTRVTLSGNNVTEHKKSERLTHLSGLASKPDDIRYLTDIHDSMSQSPKGLTRRQLNEIQHNATLTRKTNEEHAYYETLNSGPARRGLFSPPLHGPEYWLNK